MTTNVAKQSWALLAGALLVLNTLILFPHALPYLLGGVLVCFVLLSATIGAGAVVAERKASAQVAQLIPPVLPLMTPAAPSPYEPVLTSTSEQFGSADPYPFSRETAPTAALDLDGLIAPYIGPRRAHRQR